jgi:hypothetical protein
MGRDVLLCFVFAVVIVERHYKAKRLRVRKVELERVAVHPGSSRAPDTGTKQQSQQAASSYMIKGKSKLNCHYQEPENIFVVPQACSTSIRCQTPVIIDFGQVSLQ